MKPETKDNYIQRINKVVGYLNQHVEATPSVQDLADIAAISPFHFHRVYRAITGETPSGTIRRLRLARAAAMLKETAKPITEIAFDVGYESSQGFSKAFHEATGNSASDLRNEPKKLATVIRTLSSPPKAPKAKNEIEVKLISIKPFRVIAYRHVGRHENLFKAFRGLFDWAEKNDALANFNGIYGIPLDDPRSVDPEQCRFDCAFDLGPDVSPAKGFKELTLGGDGHAVIRHVGPYEGLEEKYDYLFGPWLSDSGFALRDAPLFNHYINDPDTAPAEEWQTDIHVPVEKTS